MLLAANESLVAYRRHHRSDVELDPAVALLVHDVDNPRSFAACVARLAEHVGAIGWDDGMRAVADLRRTIEVDGTAARRAGARWVRSTHSHDLCRTGGSPRRSTRSWCAAS